MCSEGVFKVSEGRSERKKKNIREKKEKHQTKVEAERRDKLLPFTSEKGGAERMMVRIGEEKRGKEKETNQPKT